jgi:hypothetical protein
MTDASSPPKEELSSLKEKSKGLLLKFEELRGFL